MRSWERATELQSVETAITQMCGGASDVEKRDELLLGLGKAEEALGIRRGASRMARALGDVLTRHAKEYADYVVRPLDPVFEGYLRALVHDTRFHDIRLKAVSHARVRLDRPAARERLGRRGYRCRSNHREGELSGVSLAMMLSMSATYRWSPWRALLLDDPTQYNDLIHATALFEILRNLVLFEGYQIVLATHDAEQAGFFLRKLAAAGVNVNEYRYASQSKPRLHRVE